MEQKHSIVEARGLRKNERGNIELITESDRSNTSISRLSCP
jgi:hypothetical protein